MKKILTLVAVLSLFIHTPPAHADCIMGTTGCDPCAAGDTACAQNAQKYTQQSQQVTTACVPGKFCALAPIPGLTQGVTANPAGLASFFNNLYKYLIGLSAVIAIIMIIWGGLQYATQDIPGEKRDGKEKIQQALLGLVLVLSPVLVFSIINPAILNLSINLPELKTASGSTVPTVTSCPAGLLGTPPNCLPPCGNGRRLSGGNCITPPPSNEDYQYDRPANSWCFEIVPFVQANVPCGKDSSGGALACNYMCSGRSDKCTDLLRLTKNQNPNSVKSGTSCTATP